jgi:hypothetical protein
MLSRHLGRMGRVTTARSGMVRHRQMSHLLVLWLQLIYYLWVQDRRRKPYHSSSHPAHLQRCSREYWNLMTYMVDNELPFRRNSTGTGASPTPSSTDPASPTTASTHKKSKISTIVGAVVGSLVLITLLLLGTCCFRRRRNKSKGDYAAYEGTAAGHMDRTGVLAAPYTTGLAPRGSPDSPAEALPFSDSRTWRKATHAGISPSMPSSSAPPVVHSPSSPPPAPRQPPSDFATQVPLEDLLRAVNQRMGVPGQSRPLPDSRPPSTLPPYPSDT